MSYCNVPFPAPATQSHAPTLPGTSIDCACHQMSHWCCACHTTSHCHVPFPAPATQGHAPTLPGCFFHLPPNVALVLRLPRNVTLQRTCNVFPAPATQTHTPTLPGCFNRLRLPPNVTLVLRLPHNVTIQRTIPCTSHTDPRCNWKCHVHKRANFTCTSEPISRVQANPRPHWSNKIPYWDFEYTRISTQVFYFPNTFIPPTQVPAEKKTSPRSSAAQRPALFCFSPAVFSLISFFLIHRLRWIRFF